MRSELAVVALAGIVASCALPAGRVVDKDLHRPLLNAQVAREDCIKDGIRDATPGMSRCVRLKQEFVRASENCLGTDQRVSVDSPTAAAYLSCIRRRAPEAAAYQIATEKRRS